MKHFINKLMNKKNLESPEMEQCMELIMTGRVNDVEIAAFLTALKIKGETVSEIAAAARIMRDKTEKVNLNRFYTLDTCGTGGDNQGTFNVSTAAAIVAASSGIKVVKHGNRSASSLCGSADVLEELGINIQMSPEQVQESVKSINIGFMFAPIYHKSMKYVAPVRKQLGFGTIFNILGPLSNPALANAQVLGVFHSDLTWVMASVLRHLGTEHALVVHGADGMDEISITGPTHVMELKNGKIESYVISPEDFGLERYRTVDLSGGSKTKNADIILKLFDGEKGPKRDMLLLNSGAALYAGKAAEGIKEGIELAGELIDSGKALKTLQEFIRVSQGFAAVQPA